MIFILILSILVLWIVYGRYKNRHKRKLAGLCRNSQMSLPVIGVAHHFVGTDEDRMIALMKIGREAIKQGGVAGGWLLNTLMVVVADPYDAEEVMRVSLRKMDGLEITGDLIGNGHMFAQVPIWRPRRKAIAPILGQKSMEMFLETFTRQSEVMMDQISAHSGKGPFSISKFITAYSMESICETSLGIRTDIQNNPDHPFLLAFLRFGKMFVARLMKPWLYPDFVYKLMPYYRHYKKQIDILQEFVRQVIVAKRLKFRDFENENRAECDQLQNQPDNKKSFLERLIDIGFNDEQLQEEMLVLILAGADTCTVGASFTAVMLSQYPEVQDKVYTELRAVLGDSDRPLELADAGQLKYLEAVIKETLRLYPPVPAIVRMVEKEFTLPSGFKLIPDVGVAIHIWALHRNPTFWGKDAEEFRPGRFLDTNLKHPAAFMPFSFGARNCIGSRYAMMSMMIVIATLVRRFKILPSKGASIQKHQKCKKKPLRTKFDIMMRHVDGYQLQIEPRR
ncbi:cytochrome P450 4d2-like [Plodia interpunctella]|uniref:cytochrome P450 4d2-like n=1 Tax=Plodia interpunctella TaxID=58824 RepID=UPI00236747E9|nr:cytochrome P450 4d2-like [Plodia interpunctella]